MIIQLQAFNRPTKSTHYLASLQFRLTCPLGTNQPFPALSTPKHFALRFPLLILFCHQGDQIVQPYIGEEDIALRLDLETRPEDDLLDADQAAVAAAELTIERGGGDLIGFPGRDLSHFLIWPVPSARHNRLASLARWEAAMTSPHMEHRQ